MNLPDALLPGWTAFTGWGLALLIALLAARGAPWGRLGSNLHINLWLGASVVLMGLWSIKAGIRPGLDLHLLGATVLTLMFGARLAYLAIALVLAMITAFGAAGWESYGLNLLVMGAVPIAITWAVLHLIEHRLPGHFFIYVFVCAFFGGAVAIVSSGLTASLLMFATGTYGLEYLTRNYLPFYILIAWSEALLSGMAMTLMVVYVPHWVASFDDLRYLRNR